MKAGFAWPKPGKRREYVRVRLQTDADGEHSAILYPNQGSGVLSSVCWADGLAEIREDSIIAPGDKLRFFPFQGLLA